MSILKVDDEKAYTRVDGSAIGGGTFWGLASLLTSAKDFDSILDLAHDVSGLFLNNLFLSLVFYLAHLSYCKREP